MNRFGYRQGTVTALATSLSCCSLKGDKHHAHFQVFGKFGFECPNVYASAIVFPTMLSRIGVMTPGMIAVMAPV